MHHQQVRVRSAIQGRHSNILTFQLIAVNYMSQYELNPRHVIRSGGQVLFYDVLVEMRPGLGLCGRSHRLEVSYFIHHLR